MKGATGLVTFFVTAVSIAPCKDDTCHAAPSRFGIHLGSGLASPISTGQSSSGLIWLVPKLELDVALCGAGTIRRLGTVARFGSLGLFADLPRWRGFLDTSWHRYTLEPLGGVAVNRGELSYAAGAGLSVGVMVDSRYDNLFDAGVIAEIRVGYTLDVGHGAWGLWTSLRGRAAFERAAYEEWAPAGPMSPYEAALLVVGDYSWHR